MAAAVLLMRSRYAPRLCTGKAASGLSRGGLRAFVEVGQSDGGRRQALKIRRGFDAPRWPCLSLRRLLSPTQFRQRVCFKIQATPSKTGPPHRDCIGVSNSFCRKTDRELFLCNNLLISLKESRKHSRSTFAAGPLSFGGQRPCLF